MIPPSSPSNAPIHAWQQRRPETTKARPRQASQDQTTIQQRLLGPRVRFHSNQFRQPTQPRPTSPTSQPSQTLAVVCCFASSETHAASQRPGFSGQMLICRLHHTAIASTVPVRRETARPFPTQAVISAPCLPCWQRDLGLLHLIWKRWRCVQLTVWRAFGWGFFGCLGLGGGNGGRKARCAGHVIRRFLPRDIFVLFIRFLRYACDMSYRKPYELILILEWFSYSLLTTNTLKTTSKICAFHVIYADLLFKVLSRLLSSIGRIRLYNLQVLPSIYSSPKKTVNEPNQPYLFKHL